MRHSPKQSWASTRRKRALVRMIQCAVVSSSVFSDSAPGPENYGIVLSSLMQKAESEKGNPIENHEYQRAVRFAFFYLLVRCCGSSAAGHSPSGSVRLGNNQR